MPRRGCVRIRSGRWDRGRSGSVRHVPIRCAPSRRFQQRPRATCHAHDIGRACACDPGAPARSAARDPGAPSFDLPHATRRTDPDGLDIEPMHAASACLSGTIGHRSLVDRPIAPTHTRRRRGRKRTPRGPLWTALCEQQSSTRNAARQRTRNADSRPGSSRHRCMTGWPGPNRPPGCDFGPYARPCGASADWIDRRADGRRRRRPPPCEQEITI